MSEMVIVRTYSAGVFYGKIKSRKKREGILTDSRRIWSWSGASELTELAQYGPSNPNNCKISVKVDRRIVTEIIEIIPMTSRAVKQLDAIPEWRTGS